MKLLIITQKVDEHDDVLGFFVRWIEEFSKHAEKITVMCLQNGTHHLPENVSVLSLGKEEEKGRMTYLARFFGTIWKERREYDAVFVHMNPIYVVLGGIFWKLWHKKIALWYTHKSVDLKLRVAEKFADTIFTASKESFRLPSKKVVITGHGIDREKFKMKSEKRNAYDDGILKIITVGRIAPIKNIHILIDAAAILKEQDINFEMKIAGKPATENDKKYFETLKSKVEAKKLTENIFFVGPVPYSDIEKFYWEGDIFINLSETGSLDKAVLEAMASYINILTSNEAFFDMLPEENLARQIKAEDIATKIALLSSHKKPFDYQRTVEHHTLKQVIATISKTIKLDYVV